MACLPNVGALDWALSARDFVRPRRNQDAVNLYPLQLTGAQQHQRSQHASHAADRVEEVQPQWSHPSLRSLHDFLDTRRAMCPSTDQHPSPYPLADMAQTHHIPHIPQAHQNEAALLATASGCSSASQRRAPKRVATQNIDHYLAAQRSAPGPRLSSAEGTAAFSRALLQDIEANRAARSASPMDAENNALYDYLPQPKPQSFVPAQAIQAHLQLQQVQQELQAASSVALAAQGYDFTAQGCDLMQGCATHQVTPLRCPWDEVRDNVQAQPLAHMNAVDDARLSSTGSATDSSIAAPLLTSVQPRNALNLGTTARRSEFLDSDGNVRLDEAAAVIENSLQALRYINGCMNAPSVAPHYTCQVPLYWQHAHISSADAGAPSYAPPMDTGAPVATPDFMAPETTTNIVACLMGASAHHSAHPSVPELQAHPCMTSPCMAGSLLTPVDIAALNSAGSAHTKLDAPNSAHNSGSFRRLHPVATSIRTAAPAPGISIDPLREDPAASDVYRPEASHVAHACSPASTESVGENQGAFEHIQHHDAFMSRVLSPVKTACADDSVIKLRTAEDAAAAIEAAAAAAALPCYMHAPHALAAHAPTVPVDATGSLEMLQATAAALGMLGCMPPWPHELLEASAATMGRLAPVATVPLFHPEAQLPAGFMQCDAAGLSGLGTQQQFQPQLNHVFEVDPVTGRDVILISP